MTSDMATTLGIALILALCYLVQRAHSYLINKVHNSIRYSHSGIVALPLASVGRALSEFYKSLGCSFEGIEGGALAYKRGCILTFRQVDHMVNWHLIPQVITFAHDYDSGNTRVDICYRVLPTVRITQKAANQFVASAKAEGAKAFQMLQELSRKNEAVMESGRTSAPADAGRSAGFADGLIENSYERHVQSSEIPG